MNKFDLIVIGGGPGGYVAALEAAKLGRSVALAESREVGGTCLNRGCIPTKALLRAARIYRESRESAALGIIAEHVGYSMETMHSRVDTVTGQLRGGIEALLSRAKVTLLRGHATLESAGVVMVEGERYQAEHVIIATGSSPAAPPIPGIETTGVVTSDALLQNGGVDCKRLVIVGGGVVGVEFAQVYNDLGCAVTILEATPRLLPLLDREIGQSLAMIFKKRGIAVHTGARVVAFAQEGEGLTCRFTQKEQEHAVQAECVLVCTGRVPNTKGLCPPALEQALGMVRGFVPAKADGSTAVAGIYAIGDVVLGGMQLAHAAEAQGRNASRAICGQPQAKRMEVIPACVFTEPEIAVAGLSADDAKEQGIEVQSIKHLTSANGKAVIEDADRGFAKLVHTPEGRLLGVQLMCPHASEMIGGIAAGMVHGLTVAQLEETIFPHPTVSETIIG